MSISFGVDESIAQSCKLSRVNLTAIDFTKKLLAG